MDSAIALVSILVPIYGVENYIERCARSLFEQTYPNLEFVFVNDASPDKSIAVLQQVITQYPQWEGRVTIINHDKNRGLAAARNTLIDNCRGEFLLHVDSDDWVEPNAVELLMKRQSETDADMVTGLFCRHFLNSDHEETTKEPEPLQEKDRIEILKDMLKIGSVVATWNRLIRSSLYRQNSVRCVEGIDAGEDLLITPRLVYFSRKVALCNAITYHYNQSNPHSYVNVIWHSWDMQHQLIRACLLNAEFFKDKEAFLSEAMDKQLVERLKPMLELYFQNRNRHTYNTLLGILDRTNRKYWPLIGWDRPLKRWLDRHYMIARLSVPLRILHGKVYQLKTYFF